MLYTLGTIHRYIYFSIFYPQHQYRIKLNNLYVKRIWSLGYLYSSQLLNNQSNTDIFRKYFEDIDFIGATVRRKHF